MTTLREEGVKDFVTTVNSLIDKKHDNGLGRGSKTIQNCVTSYMNVLKVNLYSSNVLNN